MCLKSIKSLKALFIQIVEDSQGYIMQFYS